MDSINSNGDGGAHNLEIEDFVGFNDLDMSFSPPCNDFFDFESEELPRYY